MGRAPRWSLLFVGVLMSACGGSHGNASRDSHVVPVEERPTEELRRQDGAEHVRVEGLLGTLSREDIRRGIVQSERRFQACVQAGIERLEVIEGALTLSFRVSTDGSVRWAYAAQSTMGSRETERCLVEVARGCQFRPPVGGEVEFVWPLEVMIPGDVRPATPWTSERVSRTVALHRSEARSCVDPSLAVTTVEVTTYVGPGGEGLSAGIASSARLPEAVLDCLSRQVTAWSFPDPGSYPAKVRFNLALGTAE